jgi:hypothetical protein
MSTAASPWDVLMKAPRFAIADSLKKSKGGAPAGTKLDRLLAVLATVESATTLSLSVQTDLSSQQVWGLLKEPRACGQVQFAVGRWYLVKGFAGRDVERAAALLRRSGWQVVSPDAGQRTKPLAEIHWIDAKVKKPDCDMTVLCWHDDSYFCGYWDDSINGWIACESGGSVLGVTHWADPDGPSAQTKNL